MAEGDSPDPKGERNVFYFGLVILIAVAIALIIGLIKLNSILREIH